MEYFNNAKYIKLRSHHNKYLVAGSDGESVKQSRNCNTKQARWSVELVENKPNLIRLRSCFDKFLTASDDPFLLGWTGKKALQTAQDHSNPSVQWEPVRADFYIKLRTATGKYLRGNFGAPPWRNSVTVDVPERSSTQDWIMWVVIPLPDDGNDVDRCTWVRNSKSLPQTANTNPQYNSLSSMPNNEIARHNSTSSSNGSEEELTHSTRLQENSSLSSSSLFIVKSSPSLSRGKKLTLFAQGDVMDLFQNAKTVRLRSNHDKFLLADDDMEKVNQERNGGSRRARWTVEYVKSVDGVTLVRFKSCYEKYLTATDDEFLLGVTGKKVKQTTPRRLDSSIEWEPLRDGMQVKFKTRYGNFLRANGGVPPWRNSITHDVPSRSRTQDWILWEVDVLEVYPKIKEPEPEPELKSEKSGGFDRSDSDVEPFAFDPPRRSESGEVGASGVKNEGRVILYNIVDDAGNVVDEDDGARSLVFKGNGVQELTQMFEQETGLTDIMLCTRSPLNGKLYPMKLALPPHHVKLHIYVVPSTSKAAAELA